MRIPTARAVLRRRARPGTPSGAYDRADVAPLRPTATAAFARQSDGLLLVHLLDREELFMTKARHVDRDVGRLLPLPGGRSGASRTEDLMAQIDEELTAPSAAAAVQVGDGIALFHRGR
jgi:hypothetical protein